MKVAARDVIGISLAVSCSRSEIKFYDIYPHDSHSKTRPRPGTTAFNEMDVVTPYLSTRDILE